MTGKPAIAVSADPARELTFDVVVGESGGATRRRLTISPGDTAAFAGLGAGPARAAEAAMAFVLDREPKEAILGAFDIAVIRRYFPEFDEAFPAYLAPPAGELGSPAS